MHYSSGVFSDPLCSQTVVNHAMAVVGYGTDPNSKMDYWIVRNSWGTNWGMKGYMKMARNVNMCAIASYMYYAKI
jgi:C1A family cysteine protease